MRIFLLFTLWFIAYSGQAVGQTNAKPAILEKFAGFPPVDPADVSKTFQAQDGFKMELLASEPLVTDPVAMVYDENGLAFVVEMNDYPYTDKTTHEAWKDNTTDKPIGKIRVLEDTDGDGKFDKSFIFAEQLSWPSGIVCWKGGVFVTATPDIWYLKDTDGDHKADIRKKVFTGFRKYNVQAVMNNPIWGLDNKLYVAGSGNGGKIVPGENLDAQPITISRNDYRIDPITEKFELISGGARFGNTFDNFGNRFICNIRNPAQQVVLENQYLARNPFLPVSSEIHDSRIPGDTLPIYRISPVEPWREERAQRWLKDPAQKKTPRSELSGGGVFTSASGITVFRGAAYGKRYEGDIFLGEVANNVIHRQKLTANGPVFKAEPADAKVEFVASTDTWFRPVNFVNAPDGTLHVLDMYRQAIEHPWSIPDDIHARIDLEKGRDMGRIYRLEPPNFKVPKSKPQLGKASSSELVSFLDHPNAWWRETAQRLIFERQDKIVVESLRKLVKEAKSPLGKIHALWSLQGLDAITEPDLIAGLTDKSPRVREQAVKLCETLLPKSDSLFEKISQLTSDDDARLRFQVALSVSEDGPKAAPILARIAVRDGNDPWTRAAILSCPPDTSVGLVKSLLTNHAFVTNKTGENLLRQLTFILGAQNNTENLHEILNAYSDGPVEIQDSFMGGLGDGLRQAGKNFRTAFPNAQSIGAKKMASVLNDALHVAQTQDATDAERIKAIRLLGYDDFTKVKNALAKLLHARESQEIQIAAVRSLASIKHPDVAAILLKPWRGFTPAIREEIFTAIFARIERLEPLLKAIAAGTISHAQISPARKTMLTSHSNPAIREHAAKVFGMETAGSRKDVLEQYKTSLALQGDVAKGLKVFENNCLVCHRFGDKGNEVGPNLETIREWDAEKVMMNILDPNREVAPSFVSYEIELNDGASLSGIIVAETAGSVSLKRADGIEETVLRQNIWKISSSGMSLMPEGLESAIQPQDLADLIAFLLNK